MILGATRTLGAFVAGLLAAWSLTGLFAVAAGVALVAAAVVLVSFHQTTLGREQAPADVAPVPAGEE
jgi:VanZ family protein